MPTLETRMDDVRAVMDAAGSERAALFGYSEGGPLCILFAATYPDRVLRSSPYGSFARRIRSDDHPFAPTSEEWERFIDSTVRGLGRTGGRSSCARPARTHDEAFAQWWARFRG